ncbi:stonustoxin subunit beta-like [Osmerus eperlanus]|uniref:stonustoxin subunit beta-like n=1 Tax=Osmerus eperlanus TaxID=29151 RepID=UPI002E0EA7D9
MLWISEGGVKVTRRTEEVCPVLDRPERYEQDPQVVSKEGVWNRRIYWEVEYTGWVVIGATYKGAGRRANCGSCGLGENEESWDLGWSGSCYQVWLNGKGEDIRNVPRCSTLGVYIDQPTAIVNFYLVSAETEGEEKEVRLLHSIQTPLKEKILPSFWVGMQSSCTIVKKPE